MQTHSPSIVQTSHLARERQGDRNGARDSTLRRMKQRYMHHKQTRMGIVHSKLATMLERLVIGKRQAMSAKPILRLCLHGPPIS